MSDQPFGEVKFPEDSEVVFIDLPEEEYPLTFELVGTHTGTVHRSITITGPGVLPIERISDKVGEYVFIRHIKDGSVVTDTREHVDHVGCPWCEKKGK